MGGKIGQGMTSLSGYVQQDDLFVATLTVREHLWFQVGKQGVSERLLGSNVSQFSLKIKTLLNSSANEDQRTCFTFLNG